MGIATHNRHGGDPSRIATKWRMALRYELKVMRALGLKLKVTA
jgi:hypothetical protein